MTARDAIIIGAGQASPALARLIERGHFGGTCVNTAEHRRKPWSRVRIPRTWSAAVPTMASAPATLKSI
jgi:hypothetical protein